MEDSGSIEVIEMVIQLKKCQLREESSGQPHSSIRTLISNCAVNENFELRFYMAERKTRL